MRYKLDIYGYVAAVAFGCTLGNCSEYTGKIPSGYTSLQDWADRACINAYHLVNGNLVLDSSRQAEILEKEKEDAINNAPLLRKDIYETNEELASQYRTFSASGYVLSLKNAKGHVPIERIEISGIDPDDGKIIIFNQGLNMLDFHPAFEKLTFSDMSFLTSGGITIPTSDIVFATKTGTTVALKDIVFESNYISGVNFSIKESSAGIKTLYCKGTATKSINVTIAGSETNTKPLFGLVGNDDGDFKYRLSGIPEPCQVEFKYFDGKTTRQVFLGNPNNLITVPRSSLVTHVLLKIPSGTTIDGNVCARLAVDDVSVPENEVYKENNMEIDFSDIIEKHPTSSSVSVVIEKGIAKLRTVQADYVIGSAYPMLFDGNNTVYTGGLHFMKMTYCENVQNVPSLEFLQGKATTTNQFKILEDGSIEAHNGFFSGRIEVNSEDDIPVIKLSNSRNVTNLTTYDFEMKDNKNAGRYLSVTQYMINAGTFTYNPETETMRRTGDSYFDFLNGVIRAVGTGSPSTFGYLSVLYNANITGKLTAGQIVNASKSKLKKNFEKLQSGIEIVKDIGIYRYNLQKDKDDSKKHIGLVIGDGFQCSEEVTDEEGKGVDLYALISVCVKAIQEQQEEIEFLKKEIKKLKRNS